MTTLDFFIKQTPETREQLLEVCENTDFLVELATKDSDPDISLISPSVICIKSDKIPYIRIVVYKKGSRFVLLRKFGNKYFEVERFNYDNMPDVLRKYTDEQFIKWLSN